MRQWMSSSKISVTPCNNWEVEEDEPLARQGTFWPKAFRLKLAVTVECAPCFRQRLVGR